MKILSKELKILHEIEWSKNCCQAAWLKLHHLDFDEHAYPKFFKARPRSRPGSEKSGHETALGMNWKYLDSRVRDKHEGFILKQIFDQT